MSLPLSEKATVFTKHAGIELPLICGAMFPCSNPELVAAASEAGGIGIVQPMSLVHIHGYDFKSGLRYIRTLTKKPIGFNAIVERSSARYEETMRNWVDIAIQEGIRFFITALGNPKWVVDKVHAVSGIVYHDVTNARWAQKALGHSVDGLICVNNSAGGHLGVQPAEQLYRELSKFNVPLICAGGVSTPEEFGKYIKMGYAGVQMGTRFIAAKECNVHSDYKQAIINARANDIVVTERISGVPLSVIRTEQTDKAGTKPGLIAKWLLKGKRTKKWMRMYYYIRSSRQMKNASLKGGSYKDYFVAGKSVEGIRSVESVSEIVKKITKPG